MPDEPNPDLLREKGGSGWPHLVFLDAEGEVIAHHTGMRSVADLSATGANARRLLELREKVEAGDTSVAAEYLLLRMELGLIHLADAEGEAEALELTAAQKERFETLRLELEVDAVIQDLARNPERLGAVAGRWREKGRAGLQPRQTLRFLQFWMVIFQDAYRRGDVPAMEEAAAALERRFGDSEDPSLRETLEAVRAALREKKGG